MDINNDVKKTITDNECNNSLTRNKDEDIKKIKTKKKPGPPRKTPIKQPRPRNGITDIPKDDNNYIEFLYDKPLLFKKIWQYFKLMGR